MPVNRAFYILQGHCHRFTDYDLLLICESVAIVVYHQLSKYIALRSLRNFCALCVKLPLS